MSDELTNENEIVDENTDIIPDKDPIDIKPNTGTEASPSNFRIIEFSNDNDTSVAIIKVKDFGRIYFSLLKCKNSYSKWRGKLIHIRIKIAKTCR